MHSGFLPRKLLASRQFRMNANELGDVDEFENVYRKLLSIVNGQLHGSRSLELSHAKQAIEYIDCLSNFTIVSLLLALTSCAWHDDGSKCAA
jgi:hypothetical protein